MRWHTSKIEPSPEYESHCIIKHAKDYKMVKWDKELKRFYDFDETLTAIFYPLDEIEKWCYIEEDDCTTDEMLALSAIQNAVNHVQCLYDILLTDGICCGEEYREIVGLDELQTIKQKLTKRILYLDSL